MNRIFALLAMFQTPSERGGIVLLKGWQKSSRKEQGFKPLQNGAVLCWYMGIGVAGLLCIVSNPFRTGRYCAAKENSNGTRKCF